MLTGAGGTFAQLSLYLYSVIALVGLGWGLRAVKEVHSLNLTSSHHHSRYIPSGGPEANPLLCSPILCGPYLLYLLDRILRRHLVGIHPP